MRIQTVARHCEVPPPVRDRATEQVERLGRFDPKLQSAEIIFEEEKHRKSVEGIVTREGAPPAVAQGEDSDFRAALDKMLDKLQKILRRDRSQARDHRSPRLTEVAPPPPEAGAE
jgi:ribosomal subunit interface protein